MKDPIVGIDLGTSNSVVAHADEVGVVKVLPDDGGYKIHPSVVSFHPNGGVVVGAAAKQRKVIDPSNTIYSVKRLIGRAFDSAEVQIAKGRSPFQIKEGDNKGPVIVTRQGNFAVPEISAIVLDHMRNIASSRLDCAVQRAVVTVPASFNDAQRSATATAGSIAGLTVVRVLNEPTAAALAYGNTRNLKEVIAVYDFGGGTFDITILKLNDQVYEVLGTSGDTFLGGDDLDERLVDKMVAKFLAENRIDLRTNEVSMMRLRAVAEQTKIELSRRSRAVVRIDEIAYGPKGKPLNLQIEITRDEFVNQVADIIDRTFPVCQEALTVAGISPSDIADVILVGGTTKIPYVRDQVSKFFSRAPRTDVNPEEAVAVGAALQANSLERILARPRTSSRSVPVVAPPPEASQTFDSLETGTGQSYTDVTTTPQPPDLVKPDGSLSFATDQDVTQTKPPAPKLPPGAKHPTPAWVKLPPTPTTGETGYSITRSGARDHYVGRTGAGDDEQTRPAPPIQPTTIPGVTADAFETRTPAPPPGAQPLARVTRQVPTTDPKKTAFGVPAGPPPLPRPTGRGVGAPKPPPDPGPPDSIEVAGVQFELEKEPPKKQRGLSAVLPPEDTLTLAPDFAKEVDTAEALAAAERMAQEASAASTAKGLGAARTTLQGQPPVVPLVPTASPQMPTMIAPMPIAPGYAEEQRRGKYQPPAPQPQPQQPLGPQMARAMPTILEVTPRGLGIGTVAGFCEELIRRNERLPATMKKSFTTARDKQAVVRIVVCQGESRRIGNNTIIGDLVLANLPPRPRGETTIDVTFVIDASGILQVSARDSQTGAEQRATLDLVGGVQPENVDAARERIQQLRR